MHFIRFAFVALVGLAAAAPVTGKSPPPPPPADEHLLLERVLMSFYQRRVPNLSTSTANILT